MSNLVGKKILQYSIIEKVGQGGMGVVYKAHDTKLDRTVALKFLPPNFTIGDTDKERFLQEAKAAAALSHPNVCVIHDIQEYEDPATKETTDKQQFIVMEYVDGETLRDKIKEKRLKKEEIIEIAIQIGEALQEAHNKGIVHRDVKSDNIMITASNQVKVMDFGLAKLKGSLKLTKSSSTVGTLAYMAPEQIQGGEVDARSDIFSFGVLLYEMLTGKLPFKGDYEASLIYSILNDEPEPIQNLLPDISSELLHILNRTLEKDRENRYQSMKDMLIDLRRLKRDSDRVSRDSLKVIPIKIEKEKSDKISLKKLAIASIIIILIIIGFLLVKYTTSLFDESLPLDPKPIAVLPFENLTGTSEYDIFQKSIANLFIAKLEQSQYLRVTTWERMKDLLKQMGKENIEIVDIDKEDGFELCRMDGVNAAVTGSYSKIGNTYAIEVKVLDVVTKNILVSETSNGDGENSIFNQIDNLALSISKGIGLSQQITEENQKPVVEVTTNSMEAYNYFIRAKAEHDKYYYSDAIPLYKKAIELDSTFALAYLYFARAIGQLGYINDSNAAFKNAKRFSYRATPKERFYIESNYALRIERKPKKRIRILKELVKKYPKEKLGHFRLGIYNRSQKLYTEAIEEHKIVLDLSPNYGPSLNQLGYIYSEMEDFNKALKYFKQYALAAPGEANPFDSIAELYFRMGRLDEAIANFKEALRIKPDFYDACWRLGYIFAFKEDYIEALKWIDHYYEVAPSENEKAIAHLWRGFYYYWLGRMQISLSELNQTSVLLTGIGNEGFAAFLKWIKGCIYNSIEDYSRSRKEYSKTIISNLNIQRTSITLLKLYYTIGKGVVDLKEGKLDSAKFRYKSINDLLNKTDQVIAEVLKMDINLFYGEVLLAEGLYEKVMNFDENKISLGLPGMWTIQLLPYNMPFLNDLKARAYFRKGDLDNAITEYEKLTTFDPNNKDRRLIHPTYHYNLAKLYEQKGFIMKAIVKYQKFLKLWKGADDNLPELVDAKKRLANLTKGN